jgi:hypothetical protein
VKHRLDCAIYSDDIYVERECNCGAGYGPRLLKTGLDDGPLLPTTSARSSDPLSDHADLLDAVTLLKRWTRKHPDTDLGLKTLDWLKRRNFRGNILR